MILDELFDPIKQLFYVLKKNSDYHGESIMSTIPENANRFELRKSAGLYWLLDLEQKGSTYHETLKMDEKGAMTWKLLLEGKSFEQIVEVLNQGSDEGRQRIYLNVLRFVESLKEYGVKF